MSPLAIANRRDVIGGVNASLSSLIPGPSDSSGQQSPEKLVSWRSPLGGLVLISGVGALACGVLWCFDSRVWLGENVWIKPIKFFLSIALYGLTLRILLRPLIGVWKGVGRVEWFVAFSMAVELLIINAQSARGVGSHFNQSTILDAVLYGVMGIFAAAQIPVVFALSRAFRRHRDGLGLGGALAAGIQWGLWSFILGAVQGVYMGAQPGHSVGHLSMGATLPFLGWSLSIGDLRIAHFIGLHGLQVLPLWGWIVQRWGGSRALVGVPAALYTTLCTGAWVLAVLGRSPFAWAG